MLSHCGDESNFLIAWHLLLKTVIIGSQSTWKPLALETTIGKDFLTMEPQIQLLVYAVLLQIHKINEGR